MQQPAGLRLPAPDPESAAHSARVSAHIRQQIVTAGGAISFAEFMHHALYAPGLGYYNAGTTKFGAAGDFVTAPEVSPVFGGVLARQCRDILIDMDGAAILEFGAGSGRLAADLLRSLQRFDQVPGSYRILEVSPDLAARQQELLGAEVPDLLDRVDWVDRLPERHEGIIIANEVLDALPVERFVRRDDDIAQLCVGVEKDQFVWQQHPAPAELASAVQAIESELGERLPAGFVSEICLAAPGWITDIAGSLARGVVFLFDYGVSRRDYYGRERNGGWLRCHFRHHAHDDPLLLTGIQDITAWVDFTALAEAAHAAGLSVAGFVTQAHFLLNGGLDEELIGMADLPPDAQLELSGQVKLLTLPGEMGENFKCLGLSRGSVPNPDALIAADRTARL